ncbi:MAG: endonuclease/exonuclease/phosphatase family protein [bacterium]
MSTTIRLLSYNIRALRDDNEALYRVIRSIGADVVCIQEAPRFLRWRSKCAEIARRSGLVLVTGGRATGANLVLSTLAVDVVATREVGFSRDRGLHARGSAIVLLRKGDATFAVAGTHLDLSDEPRLRHVGELHAELDEFVPAGAPAVVAGDMNCRPGSPVWTALSARGTDAHVAAGTGDGFTFRATGPYERIDGVFAEPPIRVMSSEVVASADTPLATDHCPLVVEFEI